MSANGSRPPRRPTPDVARRVALDVVRAVRADDAYANLRLPAQLRRRGVQGRDAAFATELAYGTLRGQGTYDAVLERCSHRRLETVEPAVLDVLRLGTHQLLAMRVPAHAAVASTVDLARSDRGTRPAAGLVNAVLRRVATRDLDGWVDDLAPRGSREWIAIRHMHPLWVVDVLEQALVAHGRPADELVPLLAADNRPASVTLVARPGRCSADDLRAVSGGSPGRWSPYAVVLGSGDPGQLPQVRDGSAAVQDEGSQLCALAFVQAQRVRPGRWLDLCAGPGGKTAFVDALVRTEHSGVDVALTAVEVRSHRAALVRRAVGPAVDVLVDDARSPRFATSSWDRILLDAPCTGLGALRRRPEARWRRTPDEVAPLVILQRRLLDAALAAARPGGLVAYVTCSPHIAETVEVVDQAVATRADAEVVDARPAFAGVDALGKGPTVQLWPHVHGTDAMFCALLRRR